MVYVTVEGKQNDDLCSASGLIREYRELGEGRLKLIVNNATKVLPEVFNAAEQTGLKITGVG
ncbi:MAG: hypothetical protein QXH10_10350 [Ignisphaera sp.]